MPELGMMPELAANAPRRRQLSARSTSAAIASGLFLILCTGCTATMGFFSGDDDGKSPGEGPSGPETPDLLTDCEDSIVEARLLTTRQYEHTVLDLLGLGTAESADDPRMGAAVSYSLARVDEIGAEEFDQDAEVLASQVKESLADFFPCATDVGSTDPCVTTWISQFARRAYRRKPNAAELAELQTLFEAGNQEGGAGLGVEYLMTGVLQSPDFLYRLALSTPAEDGTSAPLDGYALATRLSYFLWDSMPDEALFDAAESGALLDGELDAQVARMMNDARFSRMVRVFFNHFLGMGTFADVSRDVWSEGGTDIGETIIHSLRESVRLQMADLYASPDPNFQQLFSSSEYYLNDTLKAFYGLSTDGAPVEPCASPTEPTEPAPASAVLFENCSFGGWSVTLEAGKYSSADLLALGASSAGASSVQVSPGTEIILYQGDGQTGTSLSLESEVACLSTVDFNDATVSVEVRSTTSSDPAEPCTSSSQGSFERVDLGHEGRRGIVTHPALMTAMARPDATFPIARGLFVVENLLCQHLEVPESIDIPPLGPIPAGGTERDQLELHNADPVCSTCHSIIDPPGFAFQSFDEVGRLRTIPAGDDEGVIAGGGDLDGPFSNGVEFFERIAASKTARACFAQHFFEFALARAAIVEDAPRSDRCSLEPIEQHFAEQGDLKELIRGIVRSDSFRRRLHQLAGDP